MCGKIVEDLSGATHEKFDKGEKSCDGSTAIVGVTRQHLLVLTELFTVKG